MRNDYIFGVLYLLSYSSLIHFTQFSKVSILVYPSTIIFTWWWWWW